MSGSSSSSSRATKLRRLCANARVSHQTLSDIVRHLRADPSLLEQDCSRFALRRSIEALWSEVGYREVLELASGDPFEWDCLSLPRVLQYLCRVSDNFRGAVRDTWECHPCTADSPWHLIVYGDECVPGNVLRLDNRRKFFSVYVSVREFGPTLLKHEHMWLPLAAIRSSIAKDIPGGISRCFRQLFRRWFLVDKVSSDGVLLDLAIPGSQHARIHFRLGNVLADGDAYRAIWSAKGAAGKLPCLLCKSVLTERTTSRYLVHISCPHAEKFDLASNEDIWEKADKLTASSAETKKFHAALQMTLGLTYSPSGLLWDEELRPFVKPVDVITLDPMHGLISNGVAQNEASLLLQALALHGVTWEHIRSFVSSGWHFCRALGSPKVLLESFSSAREKAFRSDWGFKATASEMLVLCPILQYFVHRVVHHPVQEVLQDRAKQEHFRGLASGMADKIDSFDKLCRVMRLVGLIKLGSASADDLATAMTSHALAFQRAYPDAVVKPKNHYILHVPMHVARDRVLLDTFVGERKHGSMKRQADCIKNTGTFERTLLGRALNVQAAWLEDPANLRDGLLSPSEGPAQAMSDGCQAIAASLRWGGTCFHAGDCILVNGVAHILVAGAVWDDSLCIVAHRYVPAGEAISQPHLKSWVCFIDSYCHSLFGLACCFDVCASFGPVSV